MKEENNHYPSHDTHLFPYSVKLWKAQIANFGSDCRNLLCLASGNL